MPTLLPEPLFGANEFNDDVEVKQITCSLSHFAAVTSKLLYLNFKSKTQILLPVCNNNNNISNNNSF